MAFAIVWLSVNACDRSGTVLHSADSGGHADGASDGPAGCTTPAWQFPNTGTEPAWATGSCPAAGCPSGTTCVHATIAATIIPVGCAPVPAACGGTPTCSCMSCACGGQDVVCSMDPGLLCVTPTDSLRSLKTDIAYVDDDQRAALARQALEIPLARYRYKTEPLGARRRLGFIIDDQPDPSPAVLADRRHVDLYGYTSMLLATVQQQSKEIAELRRRVERLEGEHRGGAARP
jgi:hypothetical protein